MRSDISISDLLSFSDGLKVLVMGIYEYERDSYLLVKRVNETETITIGSSFFLKVKNNKDTLECEYVKDDSLIYCLMEIVKTCHEEDAV